MNNLREWVVQDYSQGFHSLLLRQCEQQNPQRGEIRLRIEAFALNWGDADLMNGRYTFVFDELPARVGMEACGIVDAIGEGVEDIKIGERYCTLPYFYFNRGASADSVTISTRYVTKAPEGLSAVESSSLWMQYMTAYFPLVELSNIGPGTNVLVTGATSTAGSAALEIGRICGANMVATSRFERNRDYLLAKGANHVCLSSNDDFTEHLRESTGGRGFDVMFDAVGGSVMKKYAQVMAKDSRIYCYGFLEGTFPELPFIELLNANGSFHPYSLFNYVENKEMCERGKAFVYKHVSSGQLRPDIDRVFAMEEYVEAWEYMKSERETHGKVLIETGN